MTVVAAIGAVVFLSVLALAVYAVYRTTRACIDAGARAVDEDAEVAELHTALAPAERDGLR